MCYLPRIVLGNPGRSHPKCYPCLGTYSISVKHNRPTLKKNFCVMNRAVHLIVRECDAVTIDNEIV